MFRCGPGEWKIHVRLDSQMLEDESILRRNHDLALQRQLAQKVPYIARTGLIEVREGLVDEQGVVKSFTGQEVGSPEPNGQKDDMVLAEAQRG